MVVDKGKNKISNIWKYQIRVLSTNIFLKSTSKLPHILQKEVILTTMWIIAAG